MKERWTAPDWVAQAHAWIATQLDRLGYEQTGEITQSHIRPWSTVMKIPTVQGDVYFKASMPALAHEPALTQYLAALRPDCMLRVLAVDTERAWMLMPDEGPMLRMMLKSTADLHHWRIILPTLAGVQQEMMAHRDALLRQGILDRRLAALPQHFERLLADHDALLIDQEDGLTTKQHRQLCGLTGRFAEMCAELAASGIPATLHHDDFHDGNIFVSQEAGKTRYAFSDWGESCLTHPFFTLLVGLRSIAYRFDLADGSAEHDFAFAPELATLRDLYLESWAEYGSPEKLRSIFTLAWQVAMVNRALTWNRVLSSIVGPEKQEQALAVPAWLISFFDAVTHEGKLL